jgi:cell wall assembly regulator SMI1
MTTIRERLAGIEGNDGASEAEVKRAEEECKLQFPPDYRNFLVEMNGGEGFIGEHYLMLWKAMELVEFNRDYQVDIYAPGLLLIASNGGGEGFGFDTRDSTLPIVQVPFIGMSLDSAVLVASSFSDLIARMERTSGSLLR